MKDIHWKLVLPVVLLMSFAVSGCDSDGPAERAGESIDRGVDKTGDSLERAGDRTRDRLDR